MSQNDFIPRLNDIVECLFEGDIDDERRGVLEHIISRVKDEDEHLRNQDTYRRLKELLHDSYLPGNPIEYIDRARNIQDIEELSHYGDIVFFPRDGILYVIGDTHGDLTSVEQIVRDTNFRERPNDVYLVFLGDYVNNGLNSIGNLITALGLKEEFPDRVVLLGGNHESRESFHTALNECFIEISHNSPGPRQGTKFIYSAE